MGPQAGGQTPMNPKVQQLLQALSQQQPQENPWGTDLATGHPATQPPIGSNQVQPPMGMPPMRPQDMRATGMGTRNEGIYPKK